MDSERRNSFGSKESIDSQRRNSKDNTEYVPTRCRITKPIPPKPAANPMQFVKIGPCELYRKAQEQLKKVEEVKSVRQEIRDDAEDWQANLDNWKSSRRKRQEHIIERVVEVKKLEQQEVEKGRRRSKTFNEILQDRNKRSTKLSISLYENDDPYDLSDYGIGLNRGANETETNKSTEDTNSIDNDSINKAESNELNTNTEQIPAATNNGNQSENENEIAIKNTVEIRNNNVIHSDKETESIKPKKSNDVKENSNVWNENFKQDTSSSSSTQMESEHYTYESAIQGYRTRVISKTNLNPVLSMSLHGLDNKSDDKTESNVNNVSISKGVILKRKELFESEKVCEPGHTETSASRRLSDDFVNSQSLKERLRSLKKYNEQTNRNTDHRYSVDNFTNTRTCTSETSDIKNNNNNNTTAKLSNDQFVRSRVSMLNNLSSDEPKSVICNNWSNKSTTSERYSSPELDEFVNKLDIIHRSLDNLNDTSNENMSLNRVQSLEGLEYCPSNYPASNSSVELLILSSQFGDTDREDSGIHTADVSCSVSQADEPVDDPDVSTSVNICMEKSDDFPTSTYVSSQSEDDSALDAIIQVTSPRNVSNSEHFVNNTIYPIEFDGIFVSENFPLNAPRTVLEPPKEKPPPPPVADPDGDPDGNLSDESGLNSTKRIKKEMRMKRSSFLGIEPDDQADIESSIAKPPDINSFLQKESRLEKQLYKKSQNSYSEAGDSQDSGVELERGRLSSDTWCSSLADTACATGVAHSRQSSEPCTTNSITSEEDEITKKEREIIELVEKEEQWRDKSEFSSPSKLNKIEPPSHNLNLDVMNSPLTEVQHKSVADYAISEDDDHSEVLRVEHELLQLEREELERQREKMVFSRAQMQSKNFLKNKRFSLEDISDSSNHPHPFMYQSDALDYRKSMPELQREAPMTGYVQQRPQFSTNVSRLPYVSPLKQPRPAPRESYERDTFINRKGSSTEDELCPLRSAASSKVPYPPTRHSTQMLSAAPRPRLVPQDNWIHPKMSTENPREKFNYNQHWLIQEAEQRRISEQHKNAVPSSIQNWKLTRPEKHLPDSVIQTLTQRVQNKVVLSERNLPGRRMENVQGHYGLHSVGHALPIHHPHMMMEESQDKMLSVSGKKKCSYCGNELGRGAAMIIESLCLFYHMDCFKCCVCHVQLGDGLMGTDVRVRNNKLHCHNCYSSDDGVKFSCV